MTFEPAAIPQTINVLVVDDEAFICSTISRFLQAEGYASVSVHSAEQALERLQIEQFQLLVSDIMMPGKSGIELLGITKQLYPNMAVIMATGVDSRETAIRALELGAYGYLIKPFAKNELIINVVNALERRRLTMASQEYEQRLEQEVLDRTADVHRREEEIALRLVTAAEYRDDETGHHIRRIGLFSAELARGLSCPDQLAADLRVAAPMHDIGKIGISDTILLKPGRLTVEEFEVVKQHTVIGAGILSDSEIPLIQLARDIALYHHERWDGTGYPSGLRGEDIPLAARIVAIADVYDALVFDRVYRPAFSEKDSLAIMRRGKATHFDPQILQCFLDVLPAFREIRRCIEQEK
ncbi:MAG: response regulator [Deltaproteobacteria bacterium RIFOXYD12_FULL_57_12]|nr:MAG: response regulator [Deltaproteobacteria bacterium RIFOXYD12_FULL_57_12]